METRLNRPFRSILCAGAIIAGLLAFNNADADGILRRGNHDEPETLDPHKSDGLEEFWVQSDMFIGLTKFDAAGKLVPDLSTGWEITPDGLSWVFHLRPNLQWSDGTPLTADDFVWSFRRALDPATAAPYASLLYPIKGARAINVGTEKDLTTLGVTAPDPNTVKFALTQPTAYFAGMMAVGIAFPVPRKAIESYHEEWTRPGKIVTSGGFMMKDWVPQQHILMVRNPHYYDAKSVALDGVDWIVEADDDTSLRSFRNGELDLSRIPIEEVPWAQKTIPNEIHTGANLWTTYLIANSQKPPLNDVRVRQALSMVIDRTILDERVVPHGQKPAYGVIPPGIEGYVQQPPDWAALSMAERVKRAQSLMTDAGYSASHPLQLDVIYAAREDNKRMLGAIVAMWKPIFVDARATPGENQVVESELRHHSFVMGYYGWIADYPDPWTFLQIFQSSAGELNQPDYRNPDYDALMAKAQDTLDPAARMAVLEQGEALLSRDQPVLPLAYDETPRLVSTRVGHYQDNAVDQHRSSDLTLAGPAP
jgi:oligopeptide transport system substrate-binding protein